VGDLEKSLDAILAGTFDLAKSMADFAKGRNLPILNMPASTYWGLKDAERAVECRQKLVDLFPTSPYKSNEPIKKQIEDDLAKCRAGVK
jgi:hypothetical protein